jgi:hypothetical protein
VLAFVFAMVVIGARLVRPHLQMLLRCDLNSLSLYLTLTKRVFKTSKEVLYA